MFRKGLLILLLVGLTLGCGSSKERGKNKYADRPTSDDKK
jgi:hypothetical protein